MESTYGTGVPKVAIPRQSRTEPRDSTRERKDESQRAPRIGRAVSAPFLSRRVSN